MSPEQKTSMTEDNRTARIVEEAVTKFREFRQKLYAILPEDCFLKRHRGVDPAFFILDIRMLYAGVIGREAICLLCKNDACPWNQRVSHPLLRWMKIRLLSSLVFESFIDRIQRRIRHSA